MSRLFEVHVLTLSKVVCLVGARVFCRLLWSGLVQVLSEIVGRRVQGRVMEVVLEELLYGGALKLSLILLHLIGVLVLPVGVRVLAVEVILSLGGQKWRDCLLTTQAGPVDIGEPWVVLDLGWTVDAEPCGWLSLN